MANHKRGRAKNRRGGCLFCKGHKANGCKRTWANKQRRVADAVEREQRKEVTHAE